MSTLTPHAEKRASSARARPLFVITIRCRDGSVERVRVQEGPRGLLPSPTATARQIKAVLTHYRPAQL
jgi:hypothetical protein